ncbi:fasciclin domain-containing protein [Croceitalea rosinachiae]|uniref:Fasciclin domain-containing protein n=1 Tax=Croceitalea rosinachiae TaxID=3075596 RepID=A0ABU3AEE8_9FLAO|nr:fasciclin domain-containing protein [Croceitalea sp. F388]MDT0608561.1 fasciclin domain-containing protein [Croceitalea sp. F388]
MKHFLQLKNFLLLFAITAFVLSCDKDDDQNTTPNQTTSTNIVETAQGNDALSSLVAALGKADENEDSNLISTLSGDGPFTVFAPTNDAFAALLADLEGFETLADFNTEEEKALLAEILKYHVVAGTATASTDLSEGQEIATVQTETVTVSLEGGVFINDSEVITPDVETSNGIVHVIDKVLVPQAVLNALNSDDLVDVVIATETLSVLEAAVIKAGLVDTLKSDGPFTVFAPTDDAFTGLLMTLGEDYSSLDDFDTEEEIALLKNILLYHVIPTKVLEADLTAGTVGTAFPENSIEIIADGETFVVGDASETNANITLTDVMATNGVAHVIDKVLLPQAALDFLATIEMMNIVETAIATDDLSLLVDALIAANAGMVDTLSGDGPFTVFAPTNHAFVNLLEILGDDYHSLTDFDTQEELDLLVKILTYHVVSGTEAFSTDLSDGQEIATVNGANVTVSLDGGVFIKDASENPAQVIIPDVDASNGVVHVIDKVLLPQEALDFVATLNMMNIVETAIATDDLSLLVDALVAANAGLVDTLSGDGPFTVFAPTNHAFVNLLEILGDDYHSLADFDTQEELDLLVKILTYHVVSGTEAFSTDLSDGQEIATVNGAKVTIGINGNGVSIKDATDDRAHVEIPDVDVSNGVVHVIDKVLLPQEALDFVATLNMMNIVETAIATDDLSLLVDALVAANAGLVDTLSGDGPFTVFAPTNHAFVNLLEILGDDYHSLTDFDTQEELDLLVKILTYHVVSGTEAFSTDLSDGQEIATVNGANVIVSLDGGVFIQDATDTDAQVIIPDVDASNGVVHVINKVLLPQEVLDILFPPTPNIVELAQSVEDLSILVDVLIQADAGLVEALSGEGPFTVFAPTNHAFENLLHSLGSSYNSIEDFDTHEERELLAKILTYHVVSGEVVSEMDITGHLRLETLHGEKIEAIEDHPIRISDKTHIDANVTAVDNIASNGIVHIIDKVLLPQEILDLLH